MKVPICKECKILGGHNGDCSQAPPGMRDEDPAQPLPCHECGRDYVYGPLKASNGTHMVWLHPNTPNNAREGCTESWRNPNGKPIHPNRIKAEGYIKGKDATGFLGEPKEVVQFTCFGCDYFFRGTTRPMVCQCGSGSFSSSFFPIPDNAPKPGIPRGHKGHVTREEQLKAEGWSTNDEVRSLMVRAMLKVWPGVVYQDTARKIEVMVDAILEEDLTRVDS